MQCLQLPFICVEEAVSRTQRFLTRNILPNKQMTKNKCLQKFYVSSIIIITSLAA